jgi:HlyD family secretion protein
MKTIKKIIYLIILIAIVLVAYSYYQKTHQIKPEDKYRLDEVTRGDVEQTVSANGTLNPVSLISVGTQVSGIVKKLYVDFNDRVEKDQILLELDNALFNAQIAQSQGSVRNNQALVELALANEKRMRELYAQDYVSKQELDTAVQALKSAQAQLASARGLLTRDQTNLNFSIIRSPVSGIVINRVVDIGQTVAASFQTPTLIQIAQDLSKMQIDTSFAEADIGNIKEGQTVKFNVDAFPNRNFEGVVKQVRLNSTNTSNVVTYNVVVSVDNSDQKLLPGMTAYVNIAVARKQQAMLVPNAALRYKPKINDNSLPNSSENNPQDKNANEKISNARSNVRRNDVERSGANRGRKRGGRGRNEDLSAGKIYVMKNGQPEQVRVRVGITDGRFTEIFARDLEVGTPIIVGELQANGQAPSGNNNMRGPRMF